MALLQELKMNDIPILIPVKGISRRCPEKNKQLLPFTVKFLAHQGCCRNAVVISDCSELLTLAANYGLKTHLEYREEGQDELVSCYNFIKDYQCDAFFLLPVTQPFRDINLMQKCCSLYEETTGEIDFITSSTEIPNRSRFYLDLDKGIPSFRDQHRLRNGESCTGIPMIDGAIYLIKTDFICRVASSSDTNHAFWSGRFRCVENEAPFMDVDTVGDMRKIEQLRFYF